jgi:hypothetical protein
MVSQVVDNAGGPGGNRTHIRGFAVPCLVHIYLIPKNILVNVKDPVKDVM